MANDRAILLIDCNNFFVSCEEVFHPSLRGKPVCVLSNNEGCVIARSNPAKDLGITMGMPYFIAREKFKNAIFLAASRGKYCEISKKIMKKLFDFTPEVEVYSIDEAFLDITGCIRALKLSYIEIAALIRKTVKSDIGIDVSVGLSSTKTLAKLASEIAKSKLRKNPLEAGIFEINEKNREEILAHTAIEEIWGIGRNLHKVMRRHNIRNARDYTLLSDDFLKRNLGKNGMELKQELLGNSVNPVDSAPALPKSISRTSSFQVFTDDKSFIKSSLNVHLHEVCTKLRRFDLTAKTLVVMLRTKDFRVFTGKITLNEPIDSEFEIDKTIYKLFDEIFIPGTIYRSSGVILAKIEPKKDTQLSLFNAESRLKSKKLSKAWDNIEKKYGTGSLKIGTTERLIE